MHIKEPRKCSPPYFIKIHKPKMSDSTSNNKRIAKNTLMLYARMLMLMLVGLYTSRITLNALGVEDYGIYNVVGGIVTMFSILSGSLSAAISRFITFELGRNDLEKLKNVFSSAITIQIILSLIIVLLAETVGLWFLNNKLVIAADRMIAANWVYQLSILTFVLNLISLPYNATIIAHERMSAFAYISIFDVFSKLLVAFSIYHSPFDKLIHFSLLLAILAIINRMIYAIYCKRQFAECVIRFKYDHNLLKQMFSFAGWNFIGASSSVLRDQGGNIILNLFYGSTVNAARAIAIQVSSHIQSFVSNFMTAINPQITKSYASGDYNYMMSLIYKGARFSYYILLILSLPVIINAQYILTIWLGIVPDHTVTFIQLVLIFAMSESLANPLVTAMLATGKIRNYQLVVGGLQMMNLPLSYIFLRFGYPPESIFVIAIFVSVCCEMARLFMLRNMINLSISSFLHKVYFNVIFVTIIASIIPIALSVILPNNFVGFIGSCISCVISTSISILFIGLSKSEFNFITSKSIILIKKIYKK